jgi:hypothetical protein
MVAFFGSKPNSKFAPFYFLYQKYSMMMLNLDLFTFPFILYPNNYLSA